VQPQWRSTESGPPALSAAVDALWPGHGRSVNAGGARVRSAPWLDLDCARPGRMTVGDSAFAVDPLRGDGVGFAIRGALLAQSVRGAIARERSAGPYLTHYAARLRHAFCRHVDECVSHYERAWNASIWQGEIAKMRRSRRLVADVPPLRFRLDHLELAPA
jgi:flavin-dependent dehydrogenase